MSERMLAGIVASFVFAGASLGGLPFDVNLDGSLDLADYEWLALCLERLGPGEPSGVVCYWFRSDLDNDVDLRDVAVFLNLFTGTVAPPVCGNGALEFGEECDDGNTISGDGCSSSCELENAGIENDSCSAPITVTDGTLNFNNVGATTDGPSHSLCEHFGVSQIESDLWYVYTASCTGAAVFSLCGSDFDTKLAVYNGSECPSVSPAACSDDDCGTGLENVQSRIELGVTPGQRYLLRVGSFNGVEGAGRLTISCNVDACATSTNDCSTPSDVGMPGCNDAVCCEATCTLDRFCCDVSWDTKCAGEAEGVCDGHFAACNGEAGACDRAGTTPGCSDVACCDSVCRTDPFCCLTEWDATCVNEASFICLLTCGAGAGPCDSTHLSPGCDDEACCALVCTEPAGDEFCCSTEWDLFCVDLAAKFCP